MMVSILHTTVCASNSTVSTDTASDCFRLHSVTPGQIYPVYLAHVYYLNAGGRV